MNRLTKQGLTLALAGAVTLGATGTSWALKNWQFQAGSAGRPAVLLFHGNGNTGAAWKDPFTTSPGLLKSAYYDHRHTPKARRIGKTHRGPNAGVYKVGASDPLKEAELSDWWSFLTGQDFTVATWDQDEHGPAFAQAYETAKEAFTKFAQQTAAPNPAAPPPIALLGHSRGGLLIRKLLKDRETLPGMERVRWVITLHSPHHGSEMARAPAQLSAEIVDLMDLKVPASIPGPFGERIPVTGPLKSELKKLATELFRPLNEWFSLERNQRELVTDGPVVRDLANGEKPVTGVKYYTFGGIEPTYVRLYLWVFDPKSAVPQYRVQTQGIHSKARQYFVWRVKAVEVPGVSPLLGQVRHFAPEIVPGKGDGLVSDASARLPFSIHETTRLNHAEVLWDRSLQLKVLGILLAK